ncbi:hypothetical protein [Parachitinimonas caeni]|uniref:Uncharacterized protein n=1 Tax=Parachitinimonas caeni TaxID=3031301 RepID=A0ABT7E330_9NEIS|nr:hypothetical protein [Parachitinimonas caeni]MDK2126727.1 hypothetical protein [Parachitinimonas caeni]
MTELGQWLVPAFALVLLTAYGLIGARLSYLVLHSELFDPWQKRAQLLLIWCLPILGWGLILAALLPSRRAGRLFIPLEAFLLLAGTVSTLQTGLDQRHDQLHSSDTHDVSTGDGGLDFD